MSAPLIFIGLPLVLAPAVHFLRRRRTTQAGIAAGAVVVLGILALILPVGRPVPALGGILIDSSLTVLGRTFAVDPADRFALAFIYPQAALLFLGARFAAPARFLLPAGLTSLGLLAAALFVRPVLFAALFLELAVTLVVLMLGDEDHPVTRGALRFLVLMTLGMPFILLTGWQLEASAANPGDASFQVTATVLLIIGFAVLLAVVPFHSWLPVVGEHAPPLAAAFAFTVLQSTILFLLLNFLSDFPWLGQNPSVHQAMGIAGGGMAVTGAVFAFGQRNFGRTMGYATMIDTGAVLLAVGWGGRLGVAAALLIVALRGLALPWWGLGLAVLRRAAGSDDFNRLRGVGRRYPLAAGAVVLGLLSLVGVPPTAGFPGRWALMHTLMPTSPAAAVILLGGMISVGLVCARGLVALLTPVEGPGQTQRESWRAIGVYSLGLVTILFVGAFPQGLLAIVTEAAAVLAAAAP